MTDRGTSDIHPVRNAHYRLDVELEFRGSEVGLSGFNPAAPEVTAVCEAAVMAARRILEDAGFQIARTGRGSRRLR